MVLQLMAHGICKNLFSCIGDNGIAKVIAATTAWLREKKKEQQLIKGLSNIMVNGPSDVCMGFRFVIFCTVRPNTTKKSGDGRKLNYLLY